MTRSITAGAESKADLTEAALTSSGTGTFSYDTASPRSGAVAFKFDSGAGGNVIARSATFTNAVDRSQFLRVYLRFVGSVPSAAVTLIRFGAGTICSVRLDASSHLELWKDAATATQIGADSAAVSADTWYRIELECKVVTGGGANSTAKARLDGTEFAASTTVDMGSVPPTSAQWGWISTGMGANAVLLADDVALNDDQGANQNTYPGDGKIVLLVPTSDSVRDALWTGGAGGTTSLFEAVNNLPPAGLDSASATDTSQIEHAGTAGGTTDDYEANMTTYTAAGLASGDTINLVQYVVVHGEDIATGAKNLSIQLLSNPADTDSGSFAVGDATPTAVSTFPTEWGVRRNGIVYAPSVTLGTAPVARVRRPETAARVASCCYMGIVVDYTPGVAATSPPPIRKRTAHVNLRR